jgi:hypothetical protein
VRALYEAGVVPVREIARLGGITERGIYKYARKHGWTPRVTRLAAGVASTAQRTAASRGASAADFAARGAGGRFIPLAEAGKPHARGIKALDPLGAARAGEECRRAGVLSEAAAAAALAAAQERAARALAEKEERTRRRVLDHVLETLLQLSKVTVVQNSKVFRSGSRSRSPPHAGEGRREIAMTPQDMACWLRVERVQHAMFDQLEGLLGYCFPSPSHLSPRAGRGRNPKTDFG